MRSLRISIAGLMSVVAVVAVELAAFQSASDGWVDICRLLTVSVLVLAAFLAAYRSGSERCFWFGFAVIGLAAYVLVLDIMADDNWPNSVISWVHRAVSGKSISESIQDLNEDDLGGFAEMQRRFRILLMMLVPPFALAGGSVAWLVNRRRYRSATL